MCLIPLLLSLSLSLSLFPSFLPLLHFFFFLCLCLPPFFSLFSFLDHPLTMDRFEVVKEIGSGNFGVARLLRDKKTKELVAVKYIERGSKVHTHSTHTHNQRLVSRLCQFICRISLQNQFVFAFLFRISLQNLFLCLKSPCDWIPDCCSLCFHLRFRCQILVSLYFHVGFRNTRYLGFFAYNTLCSLGFPLCSISDSI